MLERALFPEQIGVSSDIVCDYIKYLNSLKMRYDSIIIVRHGKVACECHRKPNSADIPHDMFSLSKSIIATAIGIAVDEGIISLDTKVYQTYFPHRLSGLKGKQREWAEKLTIHHILAMQVGKVTSVFDDKEKGDWLDDFLSCPFKFEPGTQWKYISENAFLLSWILQKETGMTVTEFLTPRLYEPLDMDVPHWDKNQFDVDAGGWGLMLTAEDLAKIAILYLNRGVYNGKRIFSEEWFKLCTFPHNRKTYPIFTDNTEYGYQVWVDHENADTTYRFTGLYGQFVYMFPDYDAAVIMTASDNRDEENIHAVYDRFPKGFIEETEERSGSVDELTALIDAAAVPANFKNPAARRNTVTEKRINNRLIKLAPAMHLSTQGATNYFMWRKKAGFLNDIKFSFSADGLAFSFKEKDSERAVINVGMDGKYIRNVITLCENKVIIDAQAAWNKDGTLELFFCNTGRPQTRRFTFTFKNHTVKLVSKTDPDYGDIAKFNIEFNMGMRVGKKAEKLLRTATPVFEAFYSDPGTVGWFVK